MGLSPRAAGSAQHARTPVHHLEVTAVTRAQSRARELTDEGHVRQRMRSFIQRPSRGSNVLCIPTAVQNVPAYTILYQHCPPKLPSVSSTVPPVSSAAACDVSRAEGPKHRMHAGPMRSLWRRM